MQWNRVGDMLGGDDVRDTSERTSSVERASRSIGRKQTSGVGGNAGLSNMGTASVVRDDGEWPRSCDGVGVGQSDVGGHAGNRIGRADVGELLAHGCQCGIKGDYTERIGATAGAGIYEGGWMRVERDSADGIGALDGTRVVGVVDEHDKRDPAE